VEAFAPELRVHEGRTIGQIADELGGDPDPFDVLLDIVVADELRTGLRPSGLRDTELDWTLRADVWRDPRTVIGGSDAGAHLDMMCGAIYSTALLAHGVREHRVLSLEAAIHLLTDVPARLYGLRDRGRIEVGAAADLVLFDPDTVGYQEERMRYDLPGGAWRLHAEATGVHRVLVNGVTVVADGATTGTTPGTLLRSGRDTETVRP
jgi:N-acyl-D-aspartate/D-glutamate deacylase